MKRFICAAAIAAVGICSAVSFGGCKAGEANVEFTLSGDGTYYIVSGVSGDRTGLTSYDVPAEYSAEEGGVSLPVKEIGDEAFFRCSRLTDLTIPDTIEVIGVRAFAQCRFTHFTIPDGVTVIGRGAFGMCDALTEITVPESVTVLDYQAFYGCAKLEKAVVKANITELTEQVFYNSTVAQGGNIYTSTSLVEIYLPATLRKFHVTSLYGNLLTDIYFAGSEDEWNGVYAYETVEDGGAESGYAEKRVEKSSALPRGVAVHFNVEF